MVVGHDGVDFMLTRRILNGGEANKEQPGGSLDAPSQYWKGDDSSRSTGTIYVSFGGDEALGAAFYAEREVAPIAFRASATTWRWGKPSRATSSSTLFDFDSKAAVSALGPLPKGAKVLTFGGGAKHGSSLQVTLTSILSQGSPALVVDLRQFFAALGSVLRVLETDSTFVWSIDRVNERLLWNADDGHRSRCITGDLATIASGDICSFNVTFG